MKREDFIATLSILLILEGYLGDNIVPALLGFSLSCYLLMLRSNVARSLVGERVLRETKLEEGKEEEILLKLKNKGNNCILKITQESEEFEVFMPQNVVLNSGEEKIISYKIRPR
ncbi:DUF58 domain-containing protein, partial [Thermococci archaeon]